MSYCSVDRVQYTAVFAESATMSHNDNGKLFFSRTHFLSFIFILIAYRILEAFSLNTALIFTFNNNNNNIARRTQGEFSATHGSTI